MPLAAGSLCGSFSKSHCEAGHLLDKLGGDRADCCWPCGCQVKFFFGFQRGKSAPYSLCYRQGAGLVSLCALCAGFS